MNIKSAIFLIDSVIENNNWKSKYTIAWKVIKEELKHCDDLKILIKKLTLFDNTNDKMYKKKE